MQVAEIEQTISQIQAERERLMARAARLTERRKGLGFDPFAGADKAARKRLHELNTEAENITAALDGVDSALAEGQRRLIEAKTAEAAKLERIQARKLAEELAIFEQSGHDLDHALATLVTASQKMKDSLSRMHALGQTVPNKMQFDTLGKNALFTALLHSIWRAYFPNTLLSPDRHTFGQLTRKWAAGIRANVERRLGGVKKASTTEN